MMTFRFSHQRARRFRLLYIAVIMTMLVSLFPQVVGQPVPTASAHNLNASVVYVYFDADTQAYLDGLIASNQRPAGQPLLRAGDELGIIILSLIHISEPTRPY